MFSSVTLFAVGKFIKNLPWGVWLFFLGLALLVLSHVYVYQRGEADQAVVTEKVKEGYEKKFKEQKRLNDLALSTQRGNTAILMTQMKSKLDALEARKPAIITKIQKVTEYVTKKSDAACTIPVGFLHLFNATADAFGPGFSADRPADVDGPSGIALSTVAEATGFNNAEAAERGEIIKLWQDWYKKSKEIFDNAKRIANPQPSN